MLKRMLKVAKAYVSSEESYIVSGAGRSCSNTII